MHVGASKQPAEQYRSLNEASAGGDSPSDLVRPAPRRKRGRPRCAVSVEQVRELLLTGLSLRMTAKTLKIAVSTAGKLRDADRDVSENHGNPSENSRLDQRNETAHPGLENATDSPATRKEPQAEPAGPERDCPDTHQPRSADPVQALVRFRRVRPASTPPPRLVESEAPGACPECGSTRWRLTLAETVICDVCHPLQIY